MSIEECAGYKSLVAAVERDEAKSTMHNYRKKLDWVLERARHYAEKTGLDAADILDAWEERRDYWYMNYYQDSGQPLITDDKVHVFDTVEALQESIGGKGFRCPSCAKASKNPYECDAGDGCDWKAYGLLGTLGKGAFVFVKSELGGENIFMPIAWEDS